MMLLKRSMRSAQPPIRSSTDLNSKENVNGLQKENETCSYALS